MRTRKLVTLIVLGTALLGACSSSSKLGSQETTTTRSAANFAVQTPDGQVSLSLDGELPPNWPGDVPVPDGATPAGSGSLVNGKANVKIGVYNSSQSPADAYDYYKTNTSLTVASATSAGVGDKYLGTVKLGGAEEGDSVVVVSSGTGSTIVITLTAAPGATSTS